MGKTGLQLSVLSFGSWVSFHKQINDSVADELMGIAYDNGINFFDNAEVYALGESEKMMGRVLKNKNWDRTSYTVSSKAFWGWRGKENKPNQSGLSRKHLVEACQEALLKLGGTKVSARPAQLLRHQDLHIEGLSAHRVEEVVADAFPLEEGIGAVHGSLDHVGGLFTVEAHSP